MLVITKFLFLSQTLNSSPEYQMAPWMLLPGKASGWTRLKLISALHTQPPPTFLSLAIGLTTRSGIQARRWKSLGLYSSVLPTTPQSPTCHLSPPPVPTALSVSPPRPAASCLGPAAACLPAPGLWSALLLALVSLSFLSFCGTKCVCLDPSLTFF